MHLLYAIFLALLRLKVGIAVDSTEMATECNDALSTNCVLLLDEPMTFWEAVGECQQNDGILLPVRNQDVTDFVVQQSSAMGLEEVWIGGRGDVVDWYWFYDEVAIAYQGCFAPSGDHDFSIVWEVSSSDETPTTCVRNCFNENFEYAAIQQDVSVSLLTCMCGDSYDLSALTSGCQAACQGNHDAEFPYCGTEDAMVVYKTSATELFSAWVDFPQSSDGGHYCALLNKNYNYVWKVSKCHHKEKYICRYDYDESTCTTPVDSTSEEYIPYRRWVAGMCISIQDQQQAQWFTAAARCHQYGGYILKILNNDEQTGLAAYLLNMPNNHYWLGLTRWTWYWQDGSSIYEYVNWEDNGPADDPDRLCMAVFFNEQYRWDNMVCEQTYPAFCQVGSPPSTVAWEGTSVSPTEEAGPSSENNSSNIYILIGAVVGLVGMVLIIVCLVCLLRRRSRTKDIPKAKPATNGISKRQDSFQDHGDTYHYIDASVMDSNAYQGLDPNARAGHTYQQPQQPSSDDQSYLRPLQPSGGSAYYQSLMAPPVPASGRPTGGVPQVPTDSPPFDTYTEPIQPLTKNIPVPSGPYTNPTYVNGDSNRPPLERQESEPGQSNDYLEVLPAE